MAATDEERSAAPPPRAQLFMCDEKTGMMHTLGLMPMAPPIVGMELDIETTPSEIPARKVRPCQSECLWYRQLHHC